MGALKVFLGFGCLLLSCYLRAETLKVAVAANIANIIAPMMSQFKTETGHEVTIISGSSGKLFAQIIHGAPFDVFLSADTQKPLSLEEKGLGFDRFTYAQGKLVLVAKSPVTLSSLGMSSSLESPIQAIALANPRFAPYGVAAEQVLNKYVKNENHPTRILAENVAQVAQYLETGAVDAGLLAASLLLKTEGWTVIDIPQANYSPIIQQGVIVKARQTTARYAASKQFKAFLLSPDVQHQLISLGYQAIDEAAIVRD